MMPTEQADQSKRVYSAVGLGRELRTSNFLLALMAAAAEERTRILSEVWEGYGHWKRLAEDRATSANNLLTRARSAEARVGELEGALKPFASFAQDNIEADSSSPGYGVWSGNRCEGERIKDWFGPTDFYRAALPTPPAPHSDEAAAVTLTKADLDFLRDVIKGQNHGWFASFDHIHRTHIHKAMALRTAGLVTFTPTTPRIVVTDAGRAALSTPPKDESQ